MPAGFNVLSRADGCDLHPVCETCPLRVCRFEMAPGQARAEMRTMALTAHLRAGMTMAQAAKTMGIGLRTAYRLAQQAKEARR